MDEHELMIDITQVARRSGISIAALGYDARRQRIPATKIGGEWKVPFSIAQSIIRDPQTYVTWRRHVGNRKKRPVMYNGTCFSSVTDLAKKLGVSRETVYNMIRRGNVVYLNKEDDVYRG